MKGLIPGDKVRIETYGDGIIRFGGIVVSVRIGPFADPNPGEIYEVQFLGDKKEYLGRYVVPEFPLSDMNIRRKL